MPTETTVKGPRDTDEYAVLLARVEGLYRESPAGRLVGTERPDYAVGTQEQSSYSWAGADAWDATFRVKAKGVEVELREEGVTLAWTWKALREDIDERRGRDPMAAAERDAQEVERRFLSQWRSGLANATRRLEDPAHPGYVTDATPSYDALHVRTERDMYRRYVELCEAHLAELRERMETLSSASALLPD